MKSTRKFLAAAALTGLLGCAAVIAHAAAITQPFTITVTVTPALSSISLSNASVTTGAVNAGTVIGAVSCATNPPGSSCVGPVTLSGADAAKFALTNGGMIPSNLVIGTTSVPSGAYAVSLSASQ